MKLERIENRIAATYKCGEFIVEIEECKDKEIGGPYHSAWLYHPDYSRKVHMFELPSITTGEIATEAFSSIIEKNIENFIFLYRAEYMDEEAE